MWSVELTLYHAVVSIANPVLLTELIFFHRRSEVWVGQKGFIILSVLLVAVVAFGYFFLTLYRPPIVVYVLTMVVVAALVLLAWRLPRQPFAPKTVTVPHPV